MAAVGRDMPTRNRPPIGPCTLAVLGDDETPPALCAIGSPRPATRRPASPRHGVSSMLPTRARDTGETDIDCAVRLSAEVADLVRRLAAAG